METRLTTKRNVASKASATDFSSAMFGKLPPQARDLEEAILGAIMIDKDALSEIVEKLKPEMFYVDAHGMIFKAVMQLFNDIKPIDMLTVIDQLKRNGELDMVGGAYYISELTNKVASSANIEYHAHIVIQKYIQRRLIGISNGIIQEAYEDTTDVLELLDKAEKGIFSVAEENLRRGSDSIRNLLTETMKEIDEAQKKKDGLTGVPSGYTDLDRMTSGWQKSDLIIVAARPAMGKTAFVLNMARYAAVEENKAVAIFSLEMGATQLVKRLISAECEIEGEKIIHGKLSDQEWATLGKRVERLAKAPIFISDTPALNIFELRAQCRRLKSAHDIQLVMIDYLQLMSGNSEGKGSTREQEISMISRSLKSIAKELQIPVIALSQLSRAVESRTGEKKPQLSDLRESGAIEQDADMVIGLYRPDYYGYEEDANGESLKGVAEVIIMKHRHGATGSVKLSFIHQYAKFTDHNQYARQMSSYEDSYNPVQFMTMKSKMDEVDDSEDGDLF
jgi:replicative DNA helicase